VVKRIGVKAMKTVSGIDLKGLLQTIRRETRPYKHGGKVI